MSDLYIEARLQAIKDIASVSCVDIKDADNIANFCDEIYSAIPNLEKIVEELEEMRNIDSCKSVKCSEQPYADCGECVQNLLINKAIEIVKAGVKNEID